MNITRIITKQFMDARNDGKVVVLYGSRQVGKTTLIKECIRGVPHHLFLTCDDPSVRRMLTNPSLAQLRDMTRGYEMIVIDEAQRVENIGITLKLMIDNLTCRIVTTGSSSFDLANTINEPLTGRTRTFHLYPFSRKELAQITPYHEQQTLLESMLIYGSYPMTLQTQKELYLKELVDSYLYKDLFEHQRIKKSQVITNLLQAIALQLGSEVSYHELSQIVGIDTTTVEKYITILEQAFVIVRLPSLARNLRNELKKSKKIYFWDLGVRNVLINNLNPLSLRTDIGALWENFMIVERMKHLDYTQTSKQLYFWRTKEQAEIDLIEEQNGHFAAYECKRSPKKSSSIPIAFAKAYPNHSYTILSSDTFSGFLGMGKSNI